ALSDLMVLSCTQKSLTEVKISEREAEAICNETQKAWPWTCWPVCVGLTCASAFVQCVCVSCVCVCVCVLVCVCVCVVCVCVCVCVCVLLMVCVSVCVCVCVFALVVSSVM